VEDVIVRDAFRWFGAYTQEATAGIRVKKKV
jgi:hypothetical protein